MSLATLTPRQLDACLAESSKTVTPADVKPATLAEQLSPFRKVLQKYRAKGYSADQIAGFLRQPNVGVDVSPSLVRKVLRGAGSDPQKARSAPPGDVVKYKPILTPVSPQSATGGTK